MTLTPSEGGRLFLALDGTFTVAWSASAKAERYQYELYPLNSDCTHPHARCNVTTGRQLTLTPDPVAGNRYTLRVRPINQSCSTQYGSWMQATFTLFSHITGHLIADPNASATLVGNACQDTDLPDLLDATPLTTITAEGQYATYTGAFVGKDASAYSLEVPWWPRFANTLVTLTPDPTLTCSCPVGCRFSGIAAPQSAVNFYLTPLNLSHTGWWQVQGGLVYAGATTGQALVSYIPVDTCNPDSTCTAALLARDAAQTPNSAGVALTGGGGVDTQSDNGDQPGYLREDNPQLSAQGLDLPFKETYAYFYRQYSMGVTPVSEFNAVADDVPEPTTPPVNGRAYFYDGRAGDFTIRQPWHIAASEQIVIFIDGNLRLQDPLGVEQLITVEQGSFLAFIVAGDIVAEASVGNTDPANTSANLAGVFIADGWLRIASRGVAAGGDDRFVGEGTYVGWRGVALERDFDDGHIRRIENNTHPVELFRFRPDFVLHVPARMAAPRYVWQET
ncbi:MAG: hypothetical protein H6673_10095 [Anaerolineales bacterium]|nr:hypothetical protein [Anaerolineales bacterium]